MAGDAKKLQPIIIKRIKKGGHAAHGGAWKIAYADFVTAMMAFFLLMWLLATTTEEQRRGISDYFQNPMRVSLMGGEGVGEQTRPIAGGGADLRASEGEVARMAMPTAVDLQAAVERQERERLEALKDSIEAAIDAIPSLQAFKGQLLLDLTSEGLRIQIVDRENRPMFDSGSAQLQPYAGEILAELSSLLNEVPNRISLSGHTDANPFVGGQAGYSNWELSNDRANAARRQLVAAGLDGEKVMRVVGLASTVLLDPEAPTSPINRRISIVVMNRDAEQAIARDGQVEQPDGSVPQAAPGSVIPVVPGQADPTAPITPTDPTDATDATDPAVRVEPAEPAVPGRESDAEAMTR